MSRIYLIIFIIVFSKCTHNPNKIVNEYDEFGRLMSKTSYNNGVKDGQSLIYYSNGVLSDSLFYSNSLLNNKNYHFDTLGNLKIMQSYYFDILIGDIINYKKNVAKDYFYIDFHKNHILECFFDSLGTCENIKSNLKAFVSDDFTENNRPIKNVLIYFPHPPSLQIKYDFGLISDNKITAKYNLNTNRLFLDTTLIAPNKNSFYYLKISCKNLRTDTTINLVNQIL